jgi:hypothetical protein
MDKYEVLHMFRICFLAFLSAEDDSAEEELYGGLACDWQKYAEAKGWYEEVATITEDLLMEEE